MRPGRSTLPGWRRRRLTPILWTTTVHLLFLALLIRTGPEATTDAQDAAIEVSLGRIEPAPIPTAASAPPPVSSPAPPVETKPEIAPLQPVATDAAPPTETPPQTGDTCAILATLQTAARADPRVLEALQRIPRSKRSVANAVMLWDGAWIDAASLGGDVAMGPIRTAIITVVSNTRPACRDQTVMGPRMLTVTGPDGATVLALGSGQWRWSDLLIDTARPMTETAG